MVQKRITENKHTGGKHIAKEIYLLSGKVFCADCGRAMVINKRKTGQRDNCIHVTYRCPSKKYICSNREINRRYLEEYVVKLLEDELLNLKALKQICKSIDKLRKSDNVADNIDSIRKDLDSTNKALQNIADAIAAGLISESLTTKLNELEIKKISLERKLQEFNEVNVFSEIDPFVILSDFADVRRNTDTPEYKSFICSFIDRIEVGRYMVNVRLKTGLDIYKDLDRTFSIRREEIYRRGKMLA